GLNHFADSAGTVAVRLDHGEEVEVPVPGGLSTVYVRVEGSGEGVTVTTREGVSDLCVGRGSVGVLVPRCGRRAGWPIMDRTDGKERAERGHRHRSSHDDPPCTACNLRCGCRGGRPCAGGEGG